MQSSEPVSHHASWRALVAAPHRLFFATGVGFILVLSAWWLAVLVARSLSMAYLEPVVPGLFVHGLVMLYLVFPPFMFGFLCTVYPRWQVAPEIPSWVIASCFGLLHAGLLLVLAGLYSLQWILALGLAVIALGWLLLLGALAWSRSHCDAPVIHANAVLLGMSAGLLGLSLGIFMILAGEYRLWPYIVSLGTWPFLAAVYFTVCHRMLPFFSSRVVGNYQPYRPDWALRLFLAAALLRAAMAGQPHWLWIPDALLLAVAAWLAWKWRTREKHGNRLLSVLHISMAWLVIALLLQLVQDMGMAIDGYAWLGRAPLHALGFGFFGGMLIAMATRVTLGHSGRPLQLDRIGWMLFLVLQLVTIVRVAAEVFTAHYSTLLLLAATGWLLVFGGWAMRYGGIYFKPRIDGRPG